MPRFLSDLGFPFGLLVFFSPSCCPPPSIPKSLFVFLSDPTCKVWSYQSPVRGFFVRTAWLRVDGGGLNVFVFYILKPDTTPPLCVQIVILRHREIHTFLATARSHVTFPSLFSSWTPFSLPHSFSLPLVFFTPPLKSADIPPPTKPSVPFLFLSIVPNSPLGLLSSTHPPYPRQKFCDPPKTMRIARPCLIHSTPFLASL